MNMARLTQFLIAISLCGISEAQYVDQPLPYTLVPASTIPNVPVPCDNNRSCRMAIEELGALVQLLKDLSNDENPRARFSEDVIIKLVNALIYVATYTSRGTEYSGSLGGVGSGKGALAGVGGILGAGVGVSIGAAAGIGAVAGATDDGKSV